MSIPNWPPPGVAVTYDLICRGNYVYRVENAHVLPETPQQGGDSPELVTGVWHLLDALESLGINTAGAWAGVIELNDNDSSRVVAWGL